MSQTPRRIVTRTTIKKAEGEFHVKAYDQANRRFEAADYFTTDRDDARETAREMVNKSKGAGN